MYPPPGGVYAVASDHRKITCASHKLGMLDDSDEITTLGGSAQFLFDFTDKRWLHTLAGVDVAAR
jgi:hypothetical protein